MQVITRDADAKNEAHLTHSSVVSPLTPECVYEVLRECVSRSFADQAKCDVLDHYSDYCDEVEALEGKIGLLECEIEALNEEIAVLAGDLRDFHDDYN